jgi:sec-independent protein translocase protein TatB
MFEIGWSELLLIGIVALIAIGPKQLPGALRTLGQWTAKLRRMASEFQNQFHEAMREAELSDLKKQVDEMTSQAKSYANFDPVADVRREFESAQRQIETSMSEQPKSESELQSGSAPPASSQNEAATAQTPGASEPVTVPTPDAGIPVTTSAPVGAPATDGRSRDGGSRPHDAEEKPA